MKHFKDTFPILTSCSECNHVIHLRQHPHVNNTIEWYWQFLPCSVHHTPPPSLRQPEALYGTQPPTPQWGWAIPWVGGRAGKTYLFWVLGLSHAGRNSNISHISKARDTPPVQNHHMKTFQTYTVICIKASLALVKNQPRKGKNTPRSAQSAWFQVNILVSWCCW